MSKLEPAGGWIDRKVATIGWPRIGSPRGVWRAAPVQGCSWMGPVSRGLTVLVVTLAASAAAAQTPSLGVGRAPTPDEIARWDISISPTGKGLPDGRGSAIDGRRVYEARCVTCHGATGAEGPEDVLRGGIGSLASDRPLKTVGSYWPLATTLWDYINRAMPFDRPTSLSPDDVYAVVAYILFLNDIVGETDVLDRRSLLQVRMPNRDGFVPDDRPDTPPAQPRD